MPPLDSLLSSAPYRPDVRLAAYQLAYDEANLRLQKAYAYPDLNLLASYDRLGSYRIGQIGFGVGFTLPLWNRNQGQIRAAAALRQASQVLYQTSLTLLSTYQDAETRYRLALQNQRISFLAYIDFFQSYKELLLNLTQLAYAYHQAQAKLQHASTTLPTAP
jgi:cobalt-zinc-cadmium efflux system outer membrane protein